MLRFKVQIFRYLCKTKIILIKFKSSIELSIHIVLLEKSITYLHFIFY